MGRHHYPAPQQWFEVGHAEVHPAGVGNSLPQDALKRAQWSWFPHQYFPTGWAELSWKPTVFPWGGVGNPATPSWVQFLSFLRLNNAVPAADTLAPRDPSDHGPWSSFTDFATRIPQMSEGHRAMGPGFGEGKGRKGKEEEELAQGSSAIANPTVTIAALLPRGLAG